MYIYMCVCDLIDLDVKVLGVYHLGDRRHDGVILLHELNFYAPIPKCPWHGTV